MRALFKRFSDFFDRLAEKWASSPFIQEAQSIFRAVWNALLFTAALLVVALFFVAGTASGYFAALVRDQPVLSAQELKRDISNNNETSTGYFAGNIPIGRLSSDLVQTKTKLNELSPDLIHAVIATEDELFYQHQGVVPKAIIRAATEELLNKPRVTGGSSITQQLVKNRILTSEVSTERKFREILLALRLERYVSKNEILESYLNMASFGRNASGINIVGAGAAAEGIFSVKAKDLSLPQAAFIAGLPKNPFSYSPFQNHGGLKTDLSAGTNRAHTVLRRMYAAGYIDKKQLDQAMTYDYRSHFAKPQKTINDDYPYLSKEIEKRASVILAKLAAEKQGYSSDRLYDDYLNYEQFIYERKQIYPKYSLAAVAKQHGKDLNTVKNHYTVFKSFMDQAAANVVIGGYRIYTTINKSIYDDMASRARNYRGYSPNQYARTADGQIMEATNSKTGKKEQVKDPMQVGSMLIENKSGRIISFVGGRGFDLSQLNFATEVTRQNGSTMKPLLVYAPALELGLIQPGSTVPDLPYIRMVNGKLYRPTNYGSTADSAVFHGFETARAALAASHNVPAVSVFTRLSTATANAPDYLKKMGVTSLVGEDGHNVSAALGGITRGITIEENTNAYTTFANNGNFIDAYMIDRITDSSGDIIYRHQTKPVKVFSAQTSYLTLDMMRDVLKYGTGAALPGMLHFSADWAGKTGTSQNWHDGWMVASNPNVTMGVWIGYPHNQQLNRSAYATQSKQLFAAFANGAYAIDPELMAPKKTFTQPSGTKKTSYCGLTGGKTTGYCTAAGFAVTDLMNSKYESKETVEPLVPVSASGKYFQFKQDFFKTHFPYTDLSAAKPELLGRIRP